ncbi:MAG: hypothetical protein EXQ94_03680 [Alphaproteobacteria bacterium]|nr:hypothetical protein [Alphaproteobacteria bacterium]
MSAQLTAEQTPTTAFAIIARADPHTLVRIVTLFARLDVMPTRLIAMTTSREPQLALTIEVPDLAREERENLVARIASLLGVVEVRAMDKPLHPTYGSDEA